MRCNNCGSEWTSNVHMDKCPFCGVPIVDETIQQPQEEADDTDIEERSDTETDSSYVRLKCPICGTVNGEDVEICPECGFAELNRVFISKEDHSLWMQQTVFPYKATYEEKKQNEEYQDFVMKADNRWMCSEDLRYPNGEIVIPKKFTYGGVNYRVTEIGKYAFYYRNNLRSITLSEGITKIGKYAFSCCYKLNSITLPEGITRIEEEDFYLCGLCEIDLPDSLESIGSRAFWGCEFSKIVLPKGVADINDEAFKYCRNLTDITIHNKVTRIGKHVFDGCDNVCIHCNDGSFAHKYAKENNIRFQLMNVVI